MSRSPVLIVVNPKSGGGLAGELVPYLRRELERLAFPVELYQSAAAGQIAERVRRIGEPLAALVVVGGDGTVREVLKGGPDSALPLAVLPAGTANVLASERGFPKAPRQTARMVDQGRSHLVDTGIVRHGESNESEPFLLFVGAGLDAQIVSDVHAKRKGDTLGMFRYVAPVLRGFMSYRPGQHWFVLEDGRRHGPFEQLIVSNVGSYGGLWKLPRGIRMNDGLLDCLGFRAKGALAMLKHGVMGTLGRLREGSDLVHVQACRVHIESEACDLLQIDGDPGGHSPVEIELRPKALRLLTAPDGEGS